MMGLVVLIPVALFFLMCYNRNKWSDSLFGKKYDSYLAGMGKKNRKGQAVVLVAVSVFFLRRAFTAMTVIFWFDFLWG